MRGTFANIRLRNLLAPGHRGRRDAPPAATARRCPSTTRRCATPHEGVAAGRARRQGVRLRLLARLGGEGHDLLGVRAVIAESFERIHRSNLVGMGVLPLQFHEGETASRSG